MMRYMNGVRVVVCVGERETGVDMCVCFHITELEASYCGGAQPICLFLIPLPYVFLFIPIQ